MKHMMKMILVAIMMMMIPLATRMRMTAAILVLKKVNVRILERKTKQKPSVVLKSANLQLGAKALSVTKKQVVALKTRKTSY